MYSSKTMLKGKNKGKRGKEEEREVEKLSPGIVLYAKSGQIRYMSIMYQ